MTRIEQLFFELVQVALGGRVKMSHVSSEQEWETLFDMAERQSVIGVLFGGIKWLKEHDDQCLVNMSEDLFLEWGVTAQLIQDNNGLLDKRCVKLLRRFGEAGMRATILKGQGIARLYRGLADLRMPGDIDVFVDSGRKEAIRMVNGMGVMVNGWDYKHAHLEIWEDTEVEMHYRVEVMYNLIKNRKLQKWFEAHTEDIFGHTENVGNERMVTPTTEFNVFYILLHIYRHFFTEGVGLRQIMDYYFVLKSHYENKTTDKYCSAVSEFGMERFAKGLMWVMQVVMAMPSEWMLWKPDEKEGRYILEQVMEGGNFGYYSDHQKYNTGRLGYVKTLCRHNLHLMKHYPSEAIWIPVWIVWHKLWKMSRGC